MAFSMAAMLLIDSLLTVSSDACKPELVVFELTEPDLFLNSVPLLICNRSSSINEAAPTIA